MQLFNGGDSLFGGLILNKGESVNDKKKMLRTVKTKNPYPLTSLHRSISWGYYQIVYAPFRHALIVQGHEYSIFGGVTDGVEFSQ